MTNNQQEVIERLEFVSAQSRLLVRELRKDPKSCWNLSIQVSELKTQLDKISKQIEDYSAFVNGI